MIAAALLVAVAVPPAAPPPRPPQAAEAPRRAMLGGGAADDAYRAALARLYDGRLDEALDALAEARRRDPGDPVGVYLEALALVWAVEQGDGAGLDQELLKRTAGARALAEARLAADPADLRARFARGAAWGMESRYHLFRAHRSDAARTAARMREDLLEVEARAPGSKDVRFGLGLYDYYADVLPKVVKVLRFFAGIPGGDRERGLASIEAAREASALHATEVRAQLYEIYAFYEDEPDRALAEARELRRQFPGWPLWGLRLAEHLRERLGLYGESAAAARDMLAQARSGHPNYAGAALALVRLSLGESLLADLRTGEARRELLAIKDGAPGAPSVGPRARLLLGRSLELEGDRDGAAVHYRIAAAGADKALREAARRALRDPLPADEVRAWQLVGQARRQREAGQPREAAAAYRRALELWPESDEAALMVAEDEVLYGRPDAARRTVTRLARQERTVPPQLGPRGRLLLAHLLDLDGDRADAVELYKNVLEAPYGRDELRRRAQDGSERPFRRPDLGGDEPEPSTYTK